MNFLGKLFSGWRKEAPSEVPAPPPQPDYGFGDLDPEAVFAQAASFFSSAPLEPSIPRVFLSDEAAQKAYRKLFPGITVRGHEVDQLAARAVMEQERIQDAWQLSGTADTWWIVAPPRYIDPTLMDIEAMDRAVTLHHQPEAWRQTVAAYYGVSPDQLTSVQLADANSGLHDVIVDFSLGRTGDNRQRLEAHHGLERTWRGRTFPGQVINGLESLGGVTVDGILAMAKLLRR